MTTRRLRKPAEGESTESIRGALVNRIGRHLRGNAVGYVALFAALGGTSYAAVSLPAGSVHSRALANGAVTHSKLARNSVGGGNLMKNSITASAFNPTLLKSLRGAAGVNGANGAAGANGGTGATGASGHNGADGSASIVMRARGTGNVSAPHGANTSIPLSGGTWTQAGNDLDLLTGSVTVQIPSSCTGSFGNSILLNVDGVATTFGVAPQAPAGGTATVPIAVGPISEPGGATGHTLTASFINSCTKSGEDYTVTGAKLDAVNFH